MATTVAQTEVTTPSNTGWTQIDSSPLSNRKYVEILNQSPQGIGIIFSTSGSAPTSAWNVGEVLLAGDKGALEPAEGAIHIYVRTETTTLTTGAAIVLREWA